jgi:hypothetical protein
LANPRCRLTLKGAVRTVEDKLRPSPKLPISLRSMELGAHDLLDAFEIKAESHEVEAGAWARLSLTRNEVPWQRRRSFDGFGRSRGRGRSSALAEEAHGRLPMGDGFLRRG